MSSAVRYLPCLAAAGGNETILYVSCCTGSVGGVLAFMLKQAQLAAMCVMARPGRVVRFVCGGSAVALVVVRGGGDAIGGADTGARAIDN